ncbi:pyridoxamine kinase [Floccifex sp.]|uniref:pyridoxamine kinase n=1 Tax=Floccifex sp. TaxID=2815810 RepID=UPI002A75B1E7|nr:pyridoxamine kinase [Floccifex sp.]MDD7281888.1 pyridoxamine kinase [Erysipelotrichaceae bacterium]MDY2958601.1 pyridoxamine kinase [Floccifex sp.]
MNHNKQKKIALINDFTGFGRCSITVQLPIISSQKIQCCPIPTSIFSNHTGFSHYYMSDFTNQMEDYITQWKELNLKFSGICTGFLGSEKQIDIVHNFIDQFKDDNTIVIVDPVMGDNGKTYSTYNQSMCDNLFSLVCKADIVTPNLTEACILTKTRYKEKITKGELNIIANKILSYGPSKVVITGIQQNTFVSNYCLEKGKEAKWVKTKKVGESRCGTGDIFTSIIASDAINNIDFYKSVKHASQFVKKCIEKTVALDIPLSDGVCFEEVI